MRFEDVYNDQINFYSLGIDTKKRTPYLSIPVRNSKIDYEEYYAITQDEYKSFFHNPALAIEFAKSCRRRKEDVRLILKPGSDRGEPW